MSRDIMIDLRAKFFSTVLILLSWPASADVETVASHIPDAALAGEARMRVLIWDVFDATLYAPEGEYNPAQPFALSLSYLRTFTSEQIVNRSISEIERQGPLDPATRDRWRGELSRIIPDVAPGMTVIGVRDAAGRAHFYLDDDQLGVVDDPEFSSRFFNIWLGPETSNPGFQRAMLAGQEL
jgi:hypothetical protein